MSTVPLYRLQTWPTIPLSGQYVIVDDNSGPDATYKPTPHQFLYNPSLEPTYFNQVNVYYHIDRFRNDFINPLLVGIPTPFTSIVAFLNSSGSSFYDPRNGRITFSHAEAREDQILYHEYAHAITFALAEDFESLNPISGNEAGAIAEGVADYLAGSFSGRTVINELTGYGNPSPGVHRDMSNPLLDNYGEYLQCRNSASYGSDEQFPTGRCGGSKVEIHLGGEFLSAVLWDLRREVGAGVADRLVIEAFTYLSGLPSFAQFSAALQSAGSAVYQGIYNSRIEKVFAARGIGTSSNVTVFSGTKTYTSDVTVPVGQTWVISRGSVWKFGSGARLYVYGTLLADGVTFSATSTSWVGINFKSGSSGLIANSVVEKTTFQAAVTVDNARVELLRSVVNKSPLSFGSSYGVWVTGASAEADIYNNWDYESYQDAVIVGRTFGILYELGARGKVYNNMISVTSTGPSSFGLVSRYGSQPDIAKYATEVLQEGVNNIFTSYNGVQVWNQSTVYGGTATNGDVGLNEFCTSGGRYAQVTSSSTAWLLYNYWLTNPPSTAKLYLDGTSQIYSGSPRLSVCSGGSWEVPNASKQFIAGGADITVTPSTEHWIGKASIQDQLRGAVYLARLDDPMARQAATDLLTELVSSSDPLISANSLRELAFLAVRTGDRSILELIHALGSSKADLLPTALAMLVIGYQAVGDDELALTKARALARLHPEGPDRSFAELNILHIYRRRGQYEAAASMLSSMRPTTPEELRALEDAQWLLSDESSVVQAPLVEDQEMSDPRQTGGKTAVEAYPNPFNPSTTLTYKVAVSQHIVLKIFDAIGREVHTLVNGYQEAGIRSVTFNADRMTSGLYLYRLIIGRDVTTGTLVLVR